MKNVGVKDTLIQMAIARWKNPRGTIRPVPGFRGIYLVITSATKYLHFDSVPTMCQRGVSVLSTYDCNQVTVMKPWRAKKRGKPYGALWVAIRNNNGKKKYFKLENLAEEVFGERWDEVKNEIRVKASQDALGELF